MTDQRTPRRTPTRADPPPPPGPYTRTVRAVDGGVEFDLTDAVLARLVELLSRRPYLLDTLARAAGHGRATGPQVMALRRAAVVELRDDHGVRATATFRLPVDDATELAAAVIAAAVGAPTHRGHRTAPTRKDPS